MSGVGSVKVNVAIHKLAQLVWPFTNFARASPWFPIAGDRTGPNQIPSLREVRNVHGAWCDPTQKFITLKELRLCVCWASYKEHTSLIT